MALGRRDKRSADLEQHHAALARVLEERHQSAAVAFEAAGELKFEQDGAHDRGRRAGHPDQIVGGVSFSPVDGDGGVCFGGWPVLHARPACQVGLSARRRLIAHIRLG